MLRLKNNKKGASAIEMVIGFLVIIMMLAFLIDIIATVSKYTTVAQVGTDVSRIVSIQGGARTSAPTGWPGGNSNYITVSKLNDMARSKFRAAGIKDSDWIIEIKNDSTGSVGLLGASGVSPVQINYLENLTVTVNLKYSWDAVSTFVPGTVNQRLVSKRPGISEWQYNYHNWIGE